MLRIEKLGTGVVLCSAMCVGACGGHTHHESGEGGRSTASPRWEPDVDAPRVDDAARVVSCDDCEGAAMLSVDACDASVAAAEMDTAGHLAFALDQSVHELIACGGMTMSLAVALIEGVVDLVIDPDGSLLPGGFEYVGEGVYRSESHGVLADVDMDVRLYHGDGEAMTLVEDDLFEVDSYLVGAHVDASASIDLDITDPFATQIDVQEPHIAYDEAGPWVRLLGLGDSPPNPIRITDLPDLSPDVGALRAEVSVHYEAEREGVLVSYDVVTPRMSLGGLVTGGRLDFEVQALSAETLDGSMRLLLDEEGWRIAYAGANALEGSVTFSVEGGSTTFVGALDYASTSYAERTVACVP